MTSSSEQPPKESLVDEMMQEYSCIFYPMCFKARELLYCPKKIGKAECDDYRPHSAPARDFVDTPEKPWCFPGCMLVCNAKVEAARKAREDVLDELAEPTIRASEEAEQNGDYVSQTCYEDVLKWIAAIRQQEGKP